MNNQDTIHTKTVSIDSRYERGKLIGRGGAGSVYEGVQLGMKRKVAIKILNPRSSSDTYQDRFDREARAVAQLNHPNCITIYDNGYDEDLDCHYMVMEFVKGETLRSHIERGMGIKRVLGFAAQILSGVQHAHEQGILHRDLKPSNVLVAKSGIVKVLDFGLALMKEDLETDRLTRDGAIYGSPPYMSPEQCRGELTVDARSDLYSFGAMLFEMLEGKLPFESVNVLDILLAHTSEPAPRITNPEVPLELSDYVNRLLQKNPDDRFESATEALHRLQEISAGYALRFGDETPIALSISEVIETWEDIDSTMTVEAEPCTKRRPFVMAAIAFLGLLSIVFLVMLLKGETITTNENLEVTPQVADLPEVIGADQPVWEEIKPSKTEPIATQAIGEANTRIHHALLVDQKMEPKEQRAKKLKASRKTDKAKLNSERKIRPIKKVTKKETGKKSEEKIEKKEKEPLKTIEFAF